MLHHGGRSFASAWSKAPPFYPSSLGAYMLALWDAENLASLTLDTTAVTTWTDTVGGIAATQATAGNKPTWGATSFNSRPGVTFAATSSKYLEAANPSLPASANPSELWALVKQDELVGAATAGTAIGYGNNNAQRLIQRVVNGGNNRAQVAVGIGASTTQIPETTVDFSGIHVVRVRITATTAFVSVDGGAETSGAAVPSTTASRLRLGANCNAVVGAYLTGVLNFAAVTAPLDTVQARLLLAYLKARGGLP